jgi:Xaa-Pro dipeptidase
MQNANLNLLALNPGPTLTYLTGFHFHLMERPVVMLLPARGTPILVLPTLEQAKVQKLAFPLHPFFFGDDPSTWANVFQRAMQSAGAGDQPIGVEPTRWRFLETNMLQQAAPQIQFASAAPVLDALRVQKDEQELAAMRKAVKIAENALQATLPSIVPGVSEAQVAAELTAQLLKAGSDPEMPFSPIVAAGENSANPHAAPSKRRLRHGDLLVIDWGAAYDGYISDLTRTFAIGDVEDELRQIAAIVREANQAGRQTAAPGVSAALVDAATRQVIDAAGYGEFFTHRTGHGIGMEAHETPYIRSGNEQVLQPGMTFTIEPGIYLPERGGVRIEDNVAITEDGVEIFSSLPRELITL